MKFVIILTLSTISFINLFNDAYGLRPTTISSESSYKTCRNIGGSIKHIDSIDPPVTVNMACFALLVPSKFDKEWAIEFLNGTKSNIKLSGNFMTPKKVESCDSGFGNRLAFKLNEYGFRVYATVLNESNPSSQELTTNARFRHKMKVVKMDVTDDGEVRKVYDEIEDDLNSNDEELWALVNNAGLISIGYIEWEYFDAYKKVFDVNNFGLVRVTRVFLPLIRLSKGRIVNIGSECGRFSVHNSAFYCMSKHAITSFSDAMRREMHKWGINVSTIEPANFNSQMICNQNINSLSDKTWAETPEIVKKAYGQKYFESQKSFCMKFNSILKRSDNLDVVVIDIMDAIRSVEPKLTYRHVDGIISRMIFTACIYLPDIFTDQLSYILNDSKPALS